MTPTRSGECQRQGAGVVKPQKGANDNRYKQRVTTTARAITNDKNEAAAGDNQEGNIGEARMTTMGSEQQAQLSERQQDQWQPEGASLISTK